MSEIQETLAFDPRDDGVLISQKDYIYLQGTRI